MTVQFPQVEPNLAPVRLIGIIRRPGEGGEGGLLDNFAIRARRSPQGIGPVRSPVGVLHWNLVPRQLAS